MATAAFLIYDGDCAFCQKSADWGTKRLGFFPALVPSKSVHPASYGLSATDVASRIWLIDGNERFGGHKAAAWILRRQPKLLWRWLALLVATPLGQLGYWLVAKNRHRLPGSTPECAIEDSPLKNSGTK